MDSVHAPSKSLLLTGPRGLSDEAVVNAVTSKDVFKFTVVRDPVSRTVSAWADKIHGGQKQRDRLMRHLGRPVDSTITLKQFIELIAKDESVLELDRHWRSQRKEISYDQIPFDFIGTLANLPKDMRYAMNRIFGEGAYKELADTRTSLGHKTKSNELMDSLTSRDMRHLEKALGADFEMYEDVQKRFGDIA